MKTPLALPIATFATLLLATTACGGSDADSGPAANEPEAVTESVDEPGGVGRWSSDQLCSLSSADAVSLQFGVANVEERAGLDDPEWTSCSWKNADEPIAQSPMSISQFGGFASDGLGSDVDLDIAGADMAGFSASVGGATAVDAVVGDQWLQITFPVGTEGAQEFGTVIASVWVAAQVGG